MGRSTLGENIITNCNRGGVIFWYSNNNIISANNITNNDGDGVYLGYSSYNSISTNNITNHDRGIWLLETSNNNIFSGNTITNNFYYGIRIQSSSNYNSISANNITNNDGDGVYLFRCNNNTISGNNITNNGKGVHLNARENTNEFYLNNFVNNTIQVEHYGVATWNKVSKGNYWDDYTGVDDNQDGIGDTPYIIDENNQDSYPLINPHISP